METPGKLQAIEVIEAIETALRSLLRIMPRWNADWICALLDIWMRRVWMPYRNAEKPV
jgi:hypothetical protein